MAMANATVKKMIVGYVREVMWSEWIQICFCKLCCEIGSQIQFLFISVSAPRLLLAITENLRIFKYGCQSVNICEATRETRIHNIRGFNLFQTHIIYEWLLLWLCFQRLIRFQCFWFGLSQFWLWVHIIVFLFGYTFRIPWPWITYKHQRSVVYNVISRIS